MARSKAFDPQTVLHRATVVFGQYGYEGASMHRLLGTLGIGRQSLYDTYGTKHELFVQAVGDYLAGKSGWTVERLANTDSPRRAIVQVLEAVVASLKDEAVREACFVLNSAVDQAPHDPKIAAVLENDLARVEEALYAALVRARDLGELRSTRDLRTLARYLNNARYWLTLTARLHSDPAVLDQLLTVIVSTLDD